MQELDRNGYGPAVLRRAAPARTEGPDPLRTQIRGDRRFDSNTLTEPGHFAEQSGLLTDILAFIAYFVALIMAVGAAFGTAVEGDSASPTVGLGSMPRRLAARLRRPSSRRRPMTDVTLKGNPFPLTGELPAVGAAAPDFNLVKQDLSGVANGDLAGRTIVLLTVPSLDTPVCAIETRKFNQRAAGLDGVDVLVASSDLPFAIKRFCGAEGIEHVHGVSDVRDRGFAARWGVAIADGPLAGCMARAAFVIGPDGNLVYSELVTEIADEPDYDAILGAASA